MPAQTSDNCHCYRTIDNLQSLRSPFFLSLNNWISLSLQYVVQTNTATLQHCNTATLQHCNTATLQHCNTGFSQAVMTTVTREATDHASSSPCLYHCRTHSVEFVPQYLNSALTVLIWFRVLGIGYHRSFPAICITRLLIAPVWTTSSER